MFRDAFVRLENSKVEPVLQELNPLLEGSLFDAHSVSVFSCDLAFYPGYQFLELSDHSAFPAHIKQIVYREGDVEILNGTNEPIYNLNQNVPIRLTQETVIDYVRFFFSNVRGKKGHFIIVETVEDIAWKEEPPPSARKAVGNMLKAIEIVENTNEEESGEEQSGADSAFFLNTCLLFKDSLFKALVKVDSKGFVEVSQEELLIEDMPILDDTLGL